MMEKPQFTNVGSTDIKEYRIRALKGLTMSDEYGIGLTVLYTRKKQEIMQLAEDRGVTEENKVLLEQSLNKIEQKVKFYSTKIPEITVEEYASVYNGINKYMDELKQYYIDKTSKDIKMKILQYDLVTFVLFGVGILATIVFK